MTMMTSSITDTDNTVDTNTNTGLNPNQKETKRGTFLIVEQQPQQQQQPQPPLLQDDETTPSTTAPTYIHCNSQTDFDLLLSHSLPAKVIPSSLASTSSTSSTTIEAAPTSSIQHPSIKIPIQSLSNTNTNTNEQSNTLTNNNNNNNQNQNNKKLQYSPKKINDSLNLNLGLPINPRNIKLIKYTCQILHYLLSYMEQYIFKKWSNIPIHIRQYITNKAWNVYFPTHKYLFRNKTGIHPNASYEYHALSSVMYWGRLFPITIPLMRFSLSQLCCCHGVDMYPVTKDNVCLLGYDTTTSSTTTRRGKGNGNGNNTIQRETGVKATYVHKVKYEMKRNQKKSPRNYYYYYLATPYERQNAPYTTNAKTNDIGPNNDPTTVTGYYIQHNSKPSKKVIFYLYGGAYLSGDSRGNLNMAEKIGQQVKEVAEEHEHEHEQQQQEYTDVFLPDYRLLPEYTFFDALYDVCLAYEYLITVQGYKPENVVLFGISSGGGLCLRLLQRIVEFYHEQQQEQHQQQQQNDMDIKEKEKKELLQTNPSGAVLMCPFVDYSEPKGSFKEYIAHDLIVNESVFEKGIPYLNTLGNEEDKKRESPVYRSMKGLPPICIIASEHECVYDQNIMLCNNARKDGVDVDLAVWKYMCHVWPVWSGFLPEARQAVDFMCHWMKDNLFS